VPSKLICLPLEFSFCLHILKQCYCNKFYFLFFSQVAASRRPVPVWAFLGRTSAGLPFQFVTHLTISIFLLSCQSCAWFLHCVSQRWIWSLSLRGCAPGGCVPGTSLVFIFASQGTGGVVRSCCSLYFLRAVQVLVSAWIFLLSSSAPVRKNRQEQKLRLLLKSSLASSKVSILVWISVWIIVGRYRYSSWVTGSKHSKIRGLNCSSAVISRTRPPVVRWNAYDDIYCSLIWFLSSISHVFLLAPIRVSAAVPNPVLNVNRCSIAMWSWSC
jgi:hypothetical protein